MRVGSQVKSSAVETDKIRVLIADDHVTVLEGLAAIIGRQPDMMVVAEAADGQEAVDLWTEHHPDVTLLDLRMPTLDGVGVIENIRKQDASARVIVLTTYDSDTEILRGIKAGDESLSLEGRAARGVTGLHPQGKPGRDLHPGIARGKAGCRPEQRIPHRPRTERAGAFGSGEEQQGDWRESLHQRNDSEIAPAQYLPQAERS